MANLNCTACSDLREDAPNFVVNGLDDDACTSLQNDTGLSTTSGNDDCTDLNNMNDCLVGNMEAEVDAYEVCDWKTFMKKFIPNVWSVFKGIICAICGIWTNIHSLWSKIDEIVVHINAVSYFGILTLYASKYTRYDGDTGVSAQQIPAFDMEVLQGNLDSGVLVKKSNYKGITVNNTTSVPLLVEATFNCSKYTEQRVACCYLVVTRDGASVGQTPFITPSTYDQQVTCEPFILDPGESAELGYYFVVGSKNTWYQSEFGYESGGSGTAYAVLDKYGDSGVQEQGSYFSVKVTSVVSQSN